MFNKYLAQTNSKTVNYFDTLLKSYSEGKKNIPNSVVLWGSDTLAQYMFSVELARLLNCKKNGDTDCDCINCNWIRNKEHPEIKTISKIDSKPSGDETKNISVKQIKVLLDEINKKSSDFRVVIFCDADYERLSKEKENHLNNFEELSKCIKLDGEKTWMPKPLNSKILQDESSNALLKTVEETPENLMFIFLTASPNDLISTIISRSQIFYIQNTFKQDYDFSKVKEIFADFPNTKKGDFDEFTQKSLTYIKESDIDLLAYFELIQAYFTELLSLNYSNPVLRKKILKTIENVVQAKKYKLAVIKDEYILDDFWLNIS